MKASSILFLFITLAVSAGAQVKNPLKKSSVLKRLIPININISTGNTSVVAHNDMSAYMSQLLEEFNKNLEVKLFMVEEDNDPEVVLNLEIVDFNIGPRDEKTVNKIVPTTNVVGKTPTGAKITQSVNSVLEQKTVQRHSNAIFKSLLVIRNDPEHRFKKTFSSSYNFSRTELVGEPAPRAAPTVSQRKLEREPKEHEYLMLLSQQELINKISNELRKYYQIQTKTAQIN